MNTHRRKWIGICGWKNSGKTTLITRLIPLFLARQKTVGVVKHTHHLLTLDTPGTDSFRYREQGATTSLLVTDKGWTMTRTTPHIPSLENMVSTMEEDRVLVEGFKNAPHPKIEVYREENAQEIGALSWPSVIALVSKTRPPSLPSHVMWVALDNLDVLIDLIEDKALSL